MSFTTRTRPLALAAGTALLALAAITGFASPALAHDELVSTELVTQETGAPEAIVLNFNNSIVEVGTEFIVQSPEGVDVTDGSAEVSGPAVTQRLQSDLEPGAYQAAWRVVSSDGHPIEGAFAIDIHTDGSAELTEPAPLANTSSEQPAESGSASGAAEDSAVAPVGVIVAISLGAVAVIAGVAAATFVGRKRRAQGMAADAQLGTDEEGK